MSPGPNVASVIDAPVAMLRARRVRGRCGRCSRYRSRPPRGTRPGRPRSCAGTASSAIRSRSSTSSVEKTGTRASSSTISAELRADISQGISRRLAPGLRERYRSICSMHVARSREILSRRVERRCAPLPRCARGAPRRGAAAKPTAAERKSALAHCGPRSISATPSDQPNTVGDARLDARRWARARRDVYAIPPAVPRYEHQEMGRSGSSADSGFVPVGSAKRSRARRGAASNSKPYRRRPSRCADIVEFQWRRGRAHDA